MRSIAQHDVEDNGEPKHTDDRRFDYFAVRCASGEDPEYVDCNPRITWQVEALPPDLLSQIISEAIATRIDREAFAEIKAEEDKLRKTITDKLARAEKLGPILRRPT